MTRLNTRAREMRKPVIFSMDVEAMFPNLHRETVAKVAASEFLQSDLEVEVDKKELSLYLAILFQGRTQVLEDLGLGEVVQKRRYPRARAVLITMDEVLSRREEGEQVGKFLDQEREPTKEEQRLMFSLALQEAVEACMSHHMYSLGEETLLQSDGGPIGLKLSEELPLGCRLLEGVVRVVEEEVEGDRLLPADQRTAKVLVDIANTVCLHTKMTVDYPSANPSGWIPLLHLKVKMGWDTTID